MSDADKYTILISRRNAKKIVIPRYFTGLKCKNGHIAERLVSNGNCIECDRIKRESITYTDCKINELKKKKREYYIKNREEIRKKQNEKLRTDVEFRKRKNESDREYRKRNIEKIREYDRDRLSKNKESKYAYFSKRRKEKRNEINEYMRNYKKNKRKTSTWGISDIYRGVIRSAIKRSGKKKEGKTIDLVGYSSEKFRIKIEYTFKDGMSWENYGDWHVDHIIPISYFINKGIYSSMVINSLCNLRAMWAIDNMKKGNKHPFGRL